MVTDIVGQSLLSTLLLGQNVTVQRSGLDKVDVIDIQGPVVWDSWTSPDLLVLLNWSLWLQEGVLGVGSVVVWLRAKVAVNIHWTISNGWVEELGGVWAVDWDLVVVWTQSVTLSVSVGEKSTLKDRVGRGLLVWNGVGWSEGSLLDLSEVVSWVLVQNQLTDTTQREVLVWPDLGQIEDGEWQLLGLLLSHGLDVDSPGWVVTSLDGLEKILTTVGWVLTTDLDGLLSGEVLDTLVTLDVDLNVVPVTLLVGPLVGVTRVTVHLSQRLWSTTVREQDT